MKKIRIFSALALTASLALAGCAGTSASSDNGDATTITVGASPVPHAEILKYVSDKLAKDAGITIKIKEYNDYVQPNVALQNNEIDANYFQHLPYLEAEIAEKNYTFDHGKGIHIEPYGVYSQKIKSLDELADGATVAVTNDPSNQARALELLVKNNLITLDTSKENPTIYDIKDNPKNLTFKEAEAPAVPKLLPDVDIAIINGNYALENNLKPSKDAIYLEDGANNPYSNILVWNSKADSKKKDAIKKLDDLLHSDEVASYIKETWPDGEVIPAF